MELPKSQKPKATRTLGIDFGMARIGVALSDESKMIAAPLFILKVETKTEQTVAKLLSQLKSHQEVNRYEIDAIVIGMPLLMSGKTGFLADEVRNFVDHLKKATDTPIILWDERLTSVQAERAMRESNMTRKKRAQIVDTVAAVIILQNYLDHRRMQKDALDAQQ